MLLVGFFFRLNICRSVHHPLLFSAIPVFTISYYQHLKCHHFCTAVHSSYPQTRVRTFGFLNVRRGPFFYLYTLLPYFIFLRVNLCLLFFLYFYNNKKLNYADGEIFFFFKLISYSIIFASRMNV